MWVLTPSGAVAWPLDAGSGPGPARPADRTYVPHVDAATGTVLTLSRRGQGAITLQAAAPGLDITKLVTPAGRIDLRLTTPDDAVRLVVNRDRLVVTRGDRKAEFDTAAPDDLVIQRFQVVLAGSVAVRRFRQLYAALGESTRLRPEGMALGNVDAMLGWLQGDVDAVRRRARPSPGTLETRALSLLSDTGDQKPSCYEVWEAEVIEAWNDYEACVYSFDWWNPAREVCAFLWVIRVESAWFTMIGCSAIPIKIEVP